MSYWQAHYLQSTFGSATGALKGIYHLCSQQILLIEVQLRPQLALTAINRPFVVPLLTSALLALLVVGIEISFDYHQISMALYVYVFPDRSQ